MNAHSPDLTARRVSVDPTLPQPGWRFYQPVDLVSVFHTPDGVCRTLHAGVYQTVGDAQEAAGITVWIKTGDRWLSECGQYRIQPVST